MIKDKNKKEIIETMRSHRICVVVPTYNNGGTLGRVLREILEYSSDVIVVNDGCTDNTQEILTEYVDRIHIVTHSVNQGKGKALKHGLQKAVQMGFRYAITIDSDGQHYPEDIPLFVEAIVKNPGTLIIGKRDLSDVDINGKSSFANKFSNFWFTVQTGRNLADTQTGFRAYPLKKLYGLNALTSRYEAELELLVFAAWNGIDILSIPIQVYYPPQSERVSHFKPALDFTRISILNTFLCFGAILYGLPVRFWKCIEKKKFFRGNFRPFTHKKGEARDASITLGRVGRSVYALSQFLFWSIALFFPFMFVNFTLTSPDEKKHMRLHNLLQWISSYFSKIFPGGKVRFENIGGETFEKPALIVANHQSYLDLPIIMSVHSKLIFIANDRLWGNPFLRSIMNNAEYQPVSLGAEELLPRLRSLRDRGYSIMIFPEGTRSEDCFIGRFHQGAFFLANELQLDIVPMVLHGAGHYLPKNESLMRKNPQTLRILERIPYGKYGDFPLRKQASAFRKIISEEYDRMARKIETPAYYRSKVLYMYAYRGWKTVSRCKSVLNQLKVYEDAISNVSGRVYFINSGIGIVPILCALSNKDAQVYAFVEDKHDYDIFAETKGIPANLNIIHAVWNDDYDIIRESGNVFLIDSGESNVRFLRFNPTIIPLKS